MRQPRFAQVSLMPPSPPQLQHMLHASRSHTAPCPPRLSLRLSSLSSSSDGVGEAPYEPPIVSPHKLTCPRASTRALACSLHARTISLHSREARRPCIASRSCKLARVCYLREREALLLLELFSFLTFLGAFAAGASLRAGESLIMSIVTERVTVWNSPSGFLYDMTRSSSCR